MHPRVSLSCYQASIFLKVSDDRVKINTNVWFAVLPFVKKSEEEVIGQQGNRNF